MARLLLLRHGQSTWNAEGRWQGWADPPLTEVGEAQAEVAAAALAGVGLTAVVASDLERARRTAEIIGERLGLGPVTVDARLRERDVGDWSGLRRDEITQRFPGQLEAWQAGELASLPNGELEADMVARIDAALAELAAGDGAVLVVTHGGVIHRVVRDRGGHRAGAGNLAGWWLEEGLVLGDAHHHDHDHDAPTNVL
jgi:probable phosphoglycerate mutase